MEPKDLELLHQLLGEDSELSGLWREHLELERRLEELSQRPYHSPEEEAEIKRLKRTKLAGRDRMEMILAEHRAAAQG